MTHDRPTVIAAPAPRTLGTIFRPEALDLLHTRYDVQDCEALDDLADETLARARYVVGQPPITPDLLDRLTDLRAVLNVEGNLLPNMPYAQVFARGIHVLTTASVFAGPVAEIGLGFALDLLRGITPADRDFAEGRERYGFEGNAEARLLSGAAVGLVGYGELGRALHHLLRAFGTTLRVHDPWLPDAAIADAGAEPSDLARLLASSDVIFTVAGVTAENRGFLDAAAFATMRRGTAFILLSRADVVDFDAMTDAVARGHITAATDVWPTEPMPADHPSRRLRGLLKSAHRAGALDVAMLRMGDLVLDDMALMDRGLPPLRCKRADRETALRMRSRPVDRT